MKYEFFYVICAVRIIWVVGQSVFYTVSECPKSEGMWNISNTRLGCKDGKTYHCLRSSNHTFIEMCDYRVNFQATKGCPFYQWSSNAFHLNQSSMCIADLDYDCLGIASYGTMTSDKMYMYPICQLPFPLVTHDQSKNTTKARNITEQKPRTKDSLSKINSDLSTVTTGGIIIAVILIIFVVVMIVLFKRVMLLSERTKCMLSLPINTDSSETGPEGSIYVEIEEVSKREEPEPYLQTNSNVENNPHGTERDMSADQEFGVQLKLHCGVKGSDSFLEPYSTENVSKRGTGTESFVEPNTCGSIAERRAESESMVEPNSNGSMGEAETGSCVKVERLGNGGGRSTDSGSRVATNTCRSKDEKRVQSESCIEPDT